MHSGELEQRMTCHLAELKRNARMRDLSEVRGVNLSSNDYLGLASNPRLRQAVLHGMEISGRCGSTGSRLMSGHHAVWAELEEHFAAFAGTEDALFFNSGFAANIGLLDCLLQPGDMVFSDSLNHASLVDGMRLGGAQKVIYPHRELNFLEDALRRQHNQTSGARLIVTESIFSMDGDRAPLDGLFQLADKYGAEVIVDEAHATGTCGPKGQGLLAELGLQKRAFATVHACGKALASAGAFVCGSRVLKQFLINRARSLMYSTALPPYLACQIRVALDLATTMDAERRHLALLSTYTRECLSGLGVNCGASESHIIPLFIGSPDETLRIAAALQGDGFGVKAIRAPSVPAGRERLRLSLTAGLSETNIAEFTNALSLQLAVKQATAR